MTRKLKVLGLALGAVFVFSAISASAASAEVLFHSNSAPTFGTLTQIGTNTFDADKDGTVKCKQVGGTGTITNATETSVRVTPIYGECTAFGLNSVIDMNGCSYLATSHGQIHVDCPTTAGGVTHEITITVLPPVPPDVHPTCVVHVPEQTVDATYTTEGTTPNRDVKVTPSVSSLITYTVTYPTGETEGKCGHAGHHTEGKYTGSVTVKGFKDAEHKVAADTWVE